MSYQWRIPFGGQRTYGARAAAFGLAGVLAWLFAACSGTNPAEISVGGNASTAAVGGNTAGGGAGAGSTGGTSTNTGGVTSIGSGGSGLSTGGTSLGSLGGTGAGPTGGTVSTTGGSFASSLTTGGSSNCPWTAQADLDNDATSWAVYAEGSPTSLIESVSAPATGGAHALRCALTGGTPYSNVHCYRNLPLTGDPQAFALRLSFWYSPSSTYNNASQASVVQGIEFTTSKWQSQQRYELALQWQNVGTGAPQWRYWDGTQPSAQRWVALPVAQELTGEQWHTLEIRGEGTNGSVHYRSFEVDGTAHPLDLTVPAISTTGELDRLAVAVQLDGNSAETPWDLMLDNVQLATCSGAACPSPTTYYQDSDLDGFGDTHKSVIACQQPAGYAAQGHDCNDADGLLRPATSTPTFNVNRCGQGMVLDGMDGSTELSSWQIITDGLGSSATSAAASGCHDTGLSLAYSLAATTQPNWVVVRRVLPAAVDMSGADFLLAPFKGDAAGLARTIEFKLEDSNGCRSAVPFTAASTLPVFRTAVISLQQFTRPQESSCAGVPVDLSKIKAIEIGISENGEDVPSPNLAATGQVTFDDLTFVSRTDLLKPQTFFECVPIRGDVLGRVARNFLRRQQPHGFIAAWYPETTPNYNTYTESVNLIVLSKEFARTGRPEYRTAAKALADRLVALQSTAGSWVDSYGDNGSGGLTATTTTFWVGNVAWAVIGLNSFIQNAAPADTSPYTNSIAQARTWLEQQITAYHAAGGAVGGITDGTEGNVSSYFALKAAGASASATALAQFLTTQAWDTREQHLRMGVKYWGLAIDVMGNWGSDFFRSIQDDTRALSGLSLAAGIFPVKAFTTPVIGMGDITGPWEPTVEFTGQYAAAGGQGAEWLMDQMLLLEDPNDPGAFSGAPDDFGGGDGWNTKMTGVSPSGWFYLGLSGGILRALE